MVFLSITIVGITVGIAGLLADTGGSEVAAMSTGVVVVVVVAGVRDPLEVLESTLVALG